MYRYYQLFTRFITTIVTIRCNINIYEMIFIMDDISCSFNHHIMYRIYIYMYISDIYGFYILYELYVFIGAYTHIYIYNDYLCAYIRFDLLMPSYDLIFWDHESKWGRIGWSLGAPGCAIGLSSTGRATLW